MKPQVLVQYILPKQILTILAGKLASMRCGRLTTLFIHWFINRYQVNMLEAENPNPSSFATFNEFFTRPLGQNVRPLAHSILVCPVDGAISQFGSIHRDQIFQAKGHQYSTASLLAGETGLAQQFKDGKFATLYLSPKDYHRIHMPCDGTLKKMIYVPGDLFSVNPTTAEHVPGLFARNERVVCVFEGLYGDFVMVLVGATIVGSMATVWHGVINPPRSKTTRIWDYTGQKIVLKKGAEMGRFLLGSTVVLLFTKDTCEFNPSWQPQKTILMGEAMSDS